jgi:N-hydroxyarylamine O-acetyltransferase
MPELSRYLDRIGYSGPIAPDLATLRALHHAHILAVPYENLDAQLGRPLGATLWPKITARHAALFPA